MRKERKIGQTPDPVHLGFTEQRQPLLRGDYHYLLARGDHLAFAAEVVRVGFSPSDFALEIKRGPSSKHSRHPSAATFSVTVENVQNRRRASYLGGPGRAWIAGFLEDLIAGTFGQP